MNKDEGQNWKYNIIFHFKNRKNNKDYFDKILSCENYIPNIGCASNLSLALKYQEIEYARDLLKNGCDVEHTPKEDSPPIFHALSTGNKEKINLILSHNPILTRTSETGYTILNSLFLTQPKLVDSYLQILIDKGADPKQINSNGRHPLHLLREKCDIRKTISIFQKYGVDVNCMDQDKVTPLMSASYMNRKDVVIALIENNATINHKNKDGMTALLFSAKKESYDVLKILIENNANVFDVNINGNNMAHILIISSETSPVKTASDQMLQFLTEHSDIMEIPNKLNLTPMQLFESTRKKKCYQKLKKMITNKKNKLKNNELIK